VDAPSRLRFHPFENDHGILASNQFGVRIGFVYEIAWDATGRRGGLNWNRTLASKCRKLGKMMESILQ
jgi:hypothetical protein